MSNFNKVHFSSESNEWYTPHDFFEDLNRKFLFSFDLAATEENSKCENFFTIEDNALAQKWHEIPGVLWCNPPYGRSIGEWIKKADIEAGKGANIVMLIPARTDTKAWHDHIFGKHEITFVRGRLKFGGSKNSAPFPCAVVHFKPREAANDT